jgi:NRPS condensation-like uncharacterized protein
VRKTQPPWYKMNSAAVLYSALQSEKYSATFRFSVLMTEPVDAAALQRAVDRTMPRFPGFAMRIRRGAFWHYLEPNLAPGPFVKEDVSDPCQPFRFEEDNHWLVRFYYYGRRISIEVFHALSDGTGAIIFFRTLLAVYLRELGYAIPNGGGVLDVDAPPLPEELEDAYSRYAGTHAKKISFSPRAFPNTGTPEPFYTFHVTMGFLPVDKLHALAKENGASITEYLAAVLISVLLEQQRNRKSYRQRPVTLAVPVNLRAFFSTQTLGNFITTISPGIDPEMGEYSFPEIVAQVHNYMKLHTNRQELRSTITQNVRLTQNPFVRVIPMSLKMLLMAKSYRIQAVNPYSCTLTNVGPFRVPDEMAPHIETMEVILGQAVVPRPHCAAISYGNTMEITFAGTQKQTDTEREFFRFLVRQGIPVRIESNR